MFTRYITLFTSSIVELASKASSTTLSTSSIVGLVSKTSSSVELAFGACYNKLHHITRHKTPQKGEDLEDLGLDDISDGMAKAFELGCGGPIPAGGAGLGVVGPFSRNDNGDDDEEEPCDEP